MTNADILKRYKIKERHIQFYYQDEGGRK